MQTRIILVRHGQTAWNREEVFRGRTDMPLDAVGLQQAEAAAAALEQEPISRVVTSPLARALMTAQTVAERHALPAIEEPAFIDIDFGRWQGLQVAEAQARYPELFATWQSAPDAVFFPEGEDLDTVADRAFAALEQLVSDCAGQTIAVIAHRVVNKVLVCRTLGLGTSRFWQIKQDTACINRLSFGAGIWVLECLNDTCHMRHLSPATGDF